MKDNPECIELKNIQYKTMLLTGKNQIAPFKEDNSDLINVENILDKEKILDQLVPWNRLEKTAKIQKLIHYSEKYAIKEKLSKTEKHSLKNQLISYLDKKLLLRNKDVVYDKDNGIITDIPALEWAANTKRFTLRRNNKSSNIKTPKTRKKTDKNEKIDISNKD